jgi:hypothetical protein
MKLYTEKIEGCDECYNRDYTVDEEGRADWYICMKSHCERICLYEEEKHIPFPSWCELDDCE